MTITLPRMAVNIDDSVWYPFTTGVDNAILFAAEPVLPLPSFTWAVLPDDDRPRVLLDRDTVAELLYCSGLDPADQLNDNTLLTAIARQLTKCRCDATVCARRFGEAVGDHLDTYCDRMAWCLWLAARATGDVL